MRENKKKLALVQRILKLAVEITNNSKPDIFVNYSGHVDYIQCLVYLQGWTDDTAGNADYRKDVFYGLYTEKESNKQLEEIIEYLKEVQKNEINSL